MAETSVVVRLKNVLNTLAALGKVLRPGSLERVDSGKPPMLLYFQCSVLLS